MAVAAFGMLHAWCSACTSPRHARANPTKRPPHAQVKLLSTGGVTDEGLWGLASGCPQLQELHLEEVGRGVTGSFLPPALQRCRQLAALHIEGMPAMDWAALQWWPMGSAAAAATDSSSTSSSVLLGSGTSLLDAGEVSSDTAASSSLLSAGREEDEEEDDVGDGEQHAGAYSTSDAAVMHGGRGGAAGPAARFVGSGNDGGSLSSDEADTQPASASGAGGSRLAGSRSARAAATLGGHASSSGISPSKQPAPQQQQPQQPAWPRLPLSLRSCRPQPPLAAMSRLHVRGAHVGTLQMMLLRMPCLTVLEVDGPARNIQAAAINW